MVANIRGYTPNYNFKLINFDTPRWHTHEYANWGQLDAMFLQVGVPGMRGEWQNATEYLEGERVFDVQTADLYRCLVKHTSPSTGTFAAARAANPGFWVLQTLGVPLYRGDWASGVQYSLGDLVKVNSYTYELCVVRHVSSTNFAADILFWTLVFDTQDTINDANQAASDANEDAEAAALSAEAAATSETNAATSEGNAFDSAEAAALSEEHAATSETNAGTSEANALESANTAALQAASLRGTSTTTHTIGNGSKTFATSPSKQFNVGNYMTIVATANPTGQVMSGAITAYNTTIGDVTVNVTGFLGAGTVSDWQLYISGMQGVKGVDGAGGGGIADAVADGKLYGRINNTWQTAVKLTGDIMTGHLSLPTTPAAANAVRKDYVDAAVGAIDLTTKVSKAGDTMTGHLVLPTGPAATNAVRKDYVDTADAAITASIPPAPVAATAAEYVANSAPTKMLTSGAVWNAAAAYGVLGMGATVTPDLSLAIDFVWNPSGVSITLGNPVNVKAGQKGVILISTQAANTSITWGSAYKFSGGIKPLLSTPAGSIDAVSYLCGGPGIMYCTFSVDMK